MPTNVAAGKVGTGLITLVANTEYVVTFVDNVLAADVISPSTNTDAVWWTADGTTPTVGGDNCYYLPPGMIDTREMATNSRPFHRSSDTVKLISTGTPTVRVQRGNL